MTRDLTAGMQAEVVKTVLQPRFFFEALFDSGALRLWNGVGTITVDGKEWTGAGNLVSVSDITEAQELRATGAAATLSGIPPELLSLALAEDYQGRRANLYLAVMDENGRVIADPYLIFGGLMDVMEIDDAGETSAITVTAESRLIDLERPREHRYEHEDQQTEYPGDLGLEYVPSIQEVPIIWGVS